MVSPIKSRSTAPRGLLWFFLIAAIACDVGVVARAAEIPAPDGYTISWNNTLLYSADVRITPSKAALLANPNSDDGDRDFAPGLTSNRLDWRSVLNISRGDFGFEVSFDAWYDSVYHARTANDSPATFNAVSVPNTTFLKAVRNLEGQYVDLTDTFVYGNFGVDGVPVSVRIGRQTLLWGESLFFDENAIAASQSPVDYLKIFDLPDGYAKDVYLPVGQLSVVAQPSSDISLAAYFQFEWRPSRLEGVGSYFSTTDILGAGAERLFLGQGLYLLHRADSSPSRAQFGFSVHKSLGDFDLGLYALTYDAKYPVLIVAPYGKSLPSGVAGEFYSAYPKGIELYGASFSTYVGDSNVMGEIAARRNMPLASYASPLSFPAIANPLTGSDGYAKGDTLHVAVSSSTALSPTPEWDSADLSFELTTDYVLGITRGGGDGMQERQLEPSARALFEPHYFEVLPNLDISIPLGLGFNKLSEYGTDYSSSTGGGDFEAGLSATYQSVWKANLTITCFLGSPDRQPLADRDFISVSFERTF